jgi:hypothetical protein
MSSRLREKLQKPDGVSGTHTLHAKLSALATPSDPITARKPVTEAAIRRRQERERRSPSHRSHRVTPTSGDGCVVAGACESALSLG